MRGEQEQEFARLLIERVGEILSADRATLLKEQDERAQREFNRYAEIQRQIDTRFDNFGAEIDVIRDTHQLTQGIGNDVQQLVQEVNTLRTSQDVLSSEFHGFASATGERLTGLEATVGEHATAIADFHKSRERSEADRKALFERDEAARIERAAILEQLRIVNAFMQRAEKRAASVASLTDEEAANIGAWLVAWYRREVGDG